MKNKKACALQAFLFLDLMRLLPIKSFVKFDIYPRNHEETVVFLRNSNMVSLYYLKLEIFA